MFGEGAEGIVSSPTPVPFESVLYFTRVGIGDGDGTISNFQATPVRVHRLDAVAQIASSGNHTCAITREEAAYCWGRNHQGQLGDSTTQARSTPRRPPPAP